MQGFQRQGLQVFPGHIQPFWIRGEKVRPPDDIHDPLIAADLPCILRDVADPGMRAPGDDDKTLPGAECERGVIKQVVGFVLS